MNHAQENVKLQDVTNTAFQIMTESDRLVEYLKIKITGNPLLLAQAIQLAITTSIRTARLTLRADIKSCMESKGQKFLFSDWPMMDGTTRLCQAPKWQLHEDAERYRKLAEGNARSQRFLQMIAQHLQEHQVVHEVLAEEELRILWERSLDFAS